MNAHSKHSAQASISLYSMRGKSWSYYQKHVANLIGESGGWTPTKSLYYSTKIDLDFERIVR